MKMTHAQVRMFRNILDSTEIAIQDDVTCLVGKNESGKTAILHALYRLNPDVPGIGFDIPNQYPAWLEKKHRLQGMDLAKVSPIRAVFRLEDGDRTEFEQHFGPDVLESDSIEVERQYGGLRTYTYSANERRAVANFVKQMDLPERVSTEALKAMSFDELREIIAQLRVTEEGQEEIVKALDTLSNRIPRALLDTDGFRAAIEKFLETRLPKFFYYDEYSNLPGRVKIRELLKADEARLSRDLLTARSLLRLAAADDDYLLNPDYERRKRELENVANAITQEVLGYWTQNQKLRVLIDISQETEKNDQEQPVIVLDEMKVRIWDDQHKLSLPIDEHSTGFRWFFSFLTAFYRYEYGGSTTSYVILLDEPALGLHARAQKDVLNFIEDRLAPKHQVIHTTHSPFMIQPGKLEHVRIVEDRGPEEGVKVSQDVMSTDPDTLFPLQGALGYDLVQHLFIAPDNLVVEGTSDYTYLRVMSDFLKDQGRSHLDDRWSVVPVGGADLIPTFVALLGTKLNVTVLIDSRKEGHQRLSRLADEGYLRHKRIITIGSVLGRKNADIEDVFVVEDYLLLYNRTFGKNLKADEVTGTDPIVSRIARHENVDRYDHGRPADALLRHREELLQKLSDDTLGRFAKLFEYINATLPAEEHK